MFSARAAARRLPSPTRGHRRLAILSDAREIVSRTTAVADVALRTAVPPGPPVPITGSARASWGPSPPPGTPPAGAPNAFHPAGSAAGG